MADAIVSGIYKIENIANSKCYVGSAIKLSRRWWTHRSQLNLGKHSNQKLQRAWLKYGAEGFKFCVIEYVADLTQLVQREQHWIEYHKAAGEKTGYNVSPTAGSPLGVKHTPETRAKLSAIRKGWVVSEATKLKLSEVLTGKKRTDAMKLAASIHRKGKKQPPELIAKRAAALTGRKMSPESIAKTASANRGVPKSDEARRRMSDAAKGRKLSEAHKALIRINLTGRPVSEATKAKISAAQVGKKKPSPSEETKLKLSLSMKAHWQKQREQTAKPETAL